MPFSNMYVLSTILHLTRLGIFLSVDPLQDFLCMMSDTTCFPADTQNISLALNSSVGCPSRQRILPHHSGYANDLPSMLLEVPKVPQIPVYILIHASDTAS